MPFEVILTILVHWQLISVTFAPPTLLIQHLRHTLSQHSGISLVRKVKQSTVTSLVHSHLLPRVRVFGSGSVTVPGPLVSPAPDLSGSPPPVRLENAGGDLPGQVPVRLPERCV